MLFENPDQPLPDEDEVIRTGRLRSALRVHERVPLESDGPIDQFAPSCIKDECGQRCRRRGDRSSYRPIAVEGLEEEVEISAVGDALLGSVGAPVLKGVKFHRHERRRSSDKAGGQGTRSGPRVTASRSVVTR